MVSNVRKSKISTMMITVEKVVRAQTSKDRRQNNSTKCSKAVITGH